METNKKTKNLGKIILIKGIVTLLLGVIHIIVTYFEYNSIKDKMPETLSFQYAIWFFLAGLLFVFIGLIELLSVKGIKLRVLLAWKVSNIASLFTFVTGIMGIIALKGEPSPPYLLFAAGFISYVFLLRSKNEFKTIYTNE